MMLRIYSVAVSVVADATGVARAVARYDRDLARQLRRAAASIVLNIAEGSGVRGGNRRLRYQTALGSAYEVQACFDVATACGYVDGGGAETRARLDHVIGTLVNLTGRRARAQGR